MSITFGSFCSGIEAPSEAWAPLGWRLAYVAEIEPFPCFYLHQRHGASRPRYMPRPEDATDLAERRARTTAARKVGELPEAGRIPNFGDVSQITATELPSVDIIAAGFPCQDFSIAGLRASLSGDRGSLSTTGVRLILEAAELGLVRGAVLEQVPDVLNTEDNAWGNILGALVGSDAALEGLEHGGKWPSAGMVAGPRARAAWRVLDAQHFGLAQRRERVWAVVDFGDGPDPAAVLFERKGLSGNHPPRREAGERAAPTLSARTRGGGGLGTDFDCDGGLVADGTQRRAAFGGNRTGGGIDVHTALSASHTASGRQDFETETFLVEGPAPTLDASFARLQGQSGQDANHGHGHLVPVAYSIMPQNSNVDYKAREVEVAQPVTSTTGVSARGGDVIVEPPIAFAIQERAVSENPDAGPDGAGFRADIGYTLEARSQQQAVAFSLRGREGGAQAEVEADDVTPALRSAEGGSTRPFVAFQGRGSNLDVDQDIAGTLVGNIDRAGGGAPMLASDYAVRRITVTEAERLQGFPDHATLIHWPSANRKGDDLAETVAYLIGHGFSAEDAATFAQTPDGPRYRAIGNSWPVNVARWLGERIDAAMESSDA